MGLLHLWKLIDFDLNLYKTTGNKEYFYYAHKNYQDYKNNGGKKYIPVLDAKIL